MSISGASRYVYEPLRTSHHTRFLVAHHIDGPPYQFEIVQGIPHEVTDYQFLSRFIGYIALSYTWGSLPRCRKLYLENGTRWILITPTLEAALPKIVFAAANLHILRIVPGRTYLWIDQICIDQDNMEERELQVSLMKEIYSQALGGLIWLGEEDDHSRIAVQAIQTVTRLARDNYPKQRQREELLRSLRAEDTNGSFLDASD
jgi:hypothetical protein